MLRECSGRSRAGSEEWPNPRSLFLSELSSSPSVPRLRFASPALALHFPPFFLLICVEFLLASSRDLLGKEPSRACELFHTFPGQLCQM